MMLPASKAGVPARAAVARLASLQRTRVVKPFSCASLSCSPGLPLRETLRQSPTTVVRSFHASPAKRASFPPGGGGGGGGFPGNFRMNLGAQGAPEKGATLKEFTTDLTELARNNKLDPVIGREDEIKRTLQILSRRTKSNPVLIGKAGTGKTTVVSGIAQRIHRGDVPDSMKDKRVLELDLAKLLGGSAVRGAFEERFKALMADIEAEEGKVIIFIDEVHQLFNLGKAEGSLDAGNMLKPALARGTLKVVGATTFEEYRRTIEKDAALARRFQPVIVDEPSVEATISILRGLRSRYEVHHGVGISDAALVSAAQLAHRYLTERNMPDGPLDLIDEAASALRLQQESKPERLEKLDREILTMQIELESLRHETDEFSRERYAELSQRLEDTQAESNKLTALWAEERSRLQRVKEIKEELEAARIELETATREGNLGKVAQLQYGRIPELERSLPKYEEEVRKVTLKGEDGNEEGMLLNDRVESEQIAAVIARQTGIPLRTLLRGERDKLLHIEDQLRRRVVGQDEALSAIGEAVRLSRAGLQSTKRPLASMLFAGSTGTGKTEVAKALAELLFDTEDSLIQISCQEYSESHSVSRLVGAPPGYVGFDEPGRFEAIRRKPYSVILFDEIEKGSRALHQLLLGILEEGKIVDSQGRTIDFRNCIILLTSNLGAEVLYRPEAVDAEGRLTAKAKDEVKEAIRHALPPELLNRLDEQLVFNRLSPENLRGIVDIRLREVAQRLAPKRITLDVDDAAHEWLASRGYDPAYGARPLNRLIMKMVLNPLARALIRGTIRPGDRVPVRVDARSGELVIEELHEPSPAPGSAGRGSGKAHEGVANESRSEADVARDGLGTGTWEVVDEGGPQSARL